MEWNLLFFFNSILLGVGLAMDAFSVSLSNGLNEPHMRVKKMCIIAGTFGFFQAFMPMAGWFCVHTIVEYFKAFENSFHGLPSSFCFISAVRWYGKDCTVRRKQKKWSALELPAF